MSEKLKNCPHFRTSELSPLRQCTISVRRPATTAFMMNHNENRSGVEGGGGRYTFDSTKAPFSKIPLFDRSTTIS